MFTAVLGKNRYRLIFELKIKCLDNIGILDTSKKLILDKNQIPNCCLQFKSPICSVIQQKLFVFIYLLKDKNKVQLGFFTVYWKV